MKYYIKKYESGNQINSQDEDLKKKLKENLKKDHKSTYQKFNESNFGKNLDYVDLGLDVVAATGIPVVSQAAGVLGMFTGVPQALFAGYDAFTNGINAQNATDMLKIIPGGALMKKLGLKWTNRLVGKYKNPKHFNLSKTPTENMSITEAFKNDPRRLIYHVPGKLWDGLGIANDIFHIENNK